MSRKRIQLSLPQQLQVIECLKDMADDLRSGKFGHESLSKYLSDKLEFDISPKNVSYVIESAGIDFVAKTPRGNGGTGPFQAHLVNRLTALEIRIANLESQLGVNASA